MRDLLKDKKIAVFGAGGLIGSAIVRGALAQGASVTAVDLQSEQLIEVLSEVGDDECQALSFAEVDACEERSVKGFFDSNADLDGMVNAIYPRGKGYGAEFLEVNGQDFLANVSLQVGSAFVIAQACAEYFKSRNEPFSLVNLASIYGSFTPRFNIYDGTAMTMPVEYAVAKAGMLQLSKYVAKYIGNTKFRVNCVSPGGVFDGQPESFVEGYRKYTHGQGLLGADDVVGVCLFLLSDLSSRITGQDVKVDDGFSL